MAKPRAVIFDLDGTLLDGRELITRAFEDVLAKRNIAITREQIASVMGKPIHAMYAELAPGYDSHMLEQEHLAHHKDNLHLLKLYDNVHETMQALQKENIKTGIFTGFNKIAHERLTLFDIAKYFDVVVDCTMYTAHKPDPEGLLLALKLLGGIDPSKTVYIGDAASDIRAGKAAGATTFGISHGFTGGELLGEAGADFVVDDLLQFKNILDTIAYNDGPQNC